MTVLRARAVLFDMDGTLVDSTHVVEHVWARFAERHDVDIAALLATSHGRTADETVRRWAPAGTDVAAEVHDLHSTELGMLEGISEIAGAASFAAQVPRWALVTSAPRSLALARLAAIGLPAPIALISSEDVSAGKPDPEPYLLGAAALGLDPAELVVFEDAEAGILSALAAGMRTVVVGPLAAPVTRGLPRIPDFTTAAVSSTGADEWFEISLD